MRPLTSQDFADAVSICLIEPCELLLEVNCRCGYGKTVCFTDLDAESRRKALKPHFWAGALLSFVRGQSRSKKGHHQVHQDFVAALLCFVWWPSRGKKGTSEKRGLL